MTGRERERIEKRILVATWLDVIFTFIGVSGISLSPPCLPVPLFRGTSNFFLFIILKKEKKISTILNELQNERRIGDEGAERKDFLDNPYTITCNSALSASKFHFFTFYLFSLIVFMCSR